MHRRRHHLTQWIAARSAPLMFCLSLAFLVCQAILVVVWVDVPNLAENAEAVIADGGTVAERVRRSLGSELVGHRIQDTAVRVKKRCANVRGQFPRVMARDSLQETLPRDVCVAIEEVCVCVCVCVCVRVCVCVPG